MPDDNTATGKAIHEARSCPWEITLNSTWKTMLRHGKAVPSSGHLRPPWLRIYRMRKDSDYSRRGNFSDERGVVQGRHVKFNRLVGSNRFRRWQLGVDARGLRIPSRPSVPCCDRVSWPWI